MPASNTSRRKRRLAAKIRKVNLFNFPPGAKKRVYRAAREALKKERLSPRDVNIIMLGDARVRALNRKFRKTDRKTDVISFRYSLDPLDGDIFLSKGVSAKQARQQGHSWADELAYLAIHGILHLAGYTDYTKAAKRRMFKTQDAIYKKVSSI